MSALSWLNPVAYLDPGAAGSSSGSGTMVILGRLEPSVPPEDRRQAMEALRDIASEEPESIEDGVALPILLSLLRPPASGGPRTEVDVELARGSLEVLTAICGTRPSAIDAVLQSANGNGSNGNGGIGGDNGNVNVNANVNGNVNVNGNAGVGSQQRKEQPAPLRDVLSLLEVDDFYVRYNAVQLVSVLLAARRSEVQGLVLLDPHGVSRLVSTVGDQREILRNEGLLLVTQLVTGSPDIQKIVVFEGCFALLLDIVDDEGYLGDGGVIARDCLGLCLTLLSQPSNRSHFREMGLVQRLRPMVESGKGIAASPQPPEADVMFLELLCDICGEIVGPVRGKGASGEKELASNQSAMAVYGVLEALVVVGLEAATANGTDRLALKALTAVGRCVDGNTRIQKTFSTLASAQGGSYFERLVKGALFDARLHAPAGICLGLFLRDNDASCVYLARSMTTSTDPESGESGDGNGEKSEAMSDPVPDPYPSVARVLLDALLGSPYGATPHTRFHAASLVAVVCGSKAAGPRLAGRRVRVPGAAVRGDHASSLPACCVVAFNAVADSPDVDVQARTAAGLLGIVCACTGRGGGVIGDPAAAAPKGTWYLGTPVDWQNLASHGGLADPSVAVSVTGMGSDAADERASLVIQGLCCFAYALALEFATGVPALPSTDPESDPIGRLSERLDSLVEYCSSGGDKLVDEGFARLLQETYGRVSTRLFMMRAGGGDGAAPVPAQQNPGAALTGSQANQPEPQPTQEKSHADPSATGHNDSNNNDINSNNNNNANANANAGIDGADGSAVNTAQGQNQNNNQNQNPIQSHPGPQAAQTGHANQNSGVSTNITNNNNTNNNDTHTNANVKAIQPHASPSYETDIGRNDTVLAELEALRRAHASLESEAIAARREAERLRAELRGAEEANRQLEEELARRPAAGESAGGVDWRAEAERARAEFEELNEEHEDLLVLLAETTEEIEELRAAQG